jgi:hypothetical protein
MTALFHVRDTLHYFLDDIITVEGDTNHGDAALSPA